MTQVIALVEYLRPTPLATPALMKALTGLRRGELLALRWRHVDLGTGEVQVVESLERRRDGSLHLKVPKTEKSARLVIFPASVVDALSIHRNQQIAYRTELGLSWEPDLVFCEPDGTPWDPDRFSSAFAYQVAKSGLPRVSLQELRHSYSSMSQRAGTPLTTTSQSMGHSTTTLTSDRYSHAVLEDFRAAADRIDRTYRAASLARR
jgi:integrase